MFDNATFDFYTEKLARDVIADEKTFAKYILENKIFVKTLVEDGILDGKDDEAISSALCLMAEADYLAAVESGREVASADSPAVSENIGGYSYSLDSAVKQKALELNATSAERQKYKILSRFCTLSKAVG